MIVTTVTSDKRHEQGGHIIRWLRNVDGGRQRLDSSI